MKNRLSQANKTIRVVSTICTCVLMISMFASCGTVIMRGGGPEGEVITFGGYPYEEVAMDVFLAAIFIEEPLAGIAGLCSLPIDLALGTLFLPMDLIYWEKGEHKGKGLSFGW